MRRRLKIQVLISCNFIMNKPKNVNSWIICSSKSYPGKFYYFNVINGESVWCLTEEENKILNKETVIKKVLDKAHSYPEPYTPPTEELEVRNNFYNYNSPPLIPFKQLQTPHIFGRPVFPKYIPNEYMQGYMPKQPIFVANKPEKKKLFDQVTQTSDHELGVLIQSCSISLSKRFSSYCNVSVPTKTIGNKDSKSSRVNWWNTKQVKNNFDTSQGTVFGPKVNKNNISNSNTDGNLFKPLFNYQNEKVNNNVIKEPVFEVFCRNNTITDDIYSCDNNFMNQFSQKSTLNIGNKVENSIFNKRKVLTTTTDNFSKKLAVQQPVNDLWAISSKNNKKNTVASQNLTLRQGNRVRTTSNNTVDIQDDTKIFNCNDLRFFLQAKRRKLHCNDGRIGQVDETPKQVINELNIKESVPKKVTFGHLNEDIVSNDSIMEDCSNSDKMSSSLILDISYLKSISKPFLKTDPWYIAIDMGVLLDHFSFIDEFVKEDITCRLLVPNLVRTYVETISVGEYAGRCRVMSARKAIRQLAAPGPHVILQPPIMDNCSSSAIEGIIECCIQVLQQNHVILVTTDKELFNKATAKGIQTYKIENIKNSLATQKAVSFDIKKINVTVDNSDLFMPNSENYERFAFRNALHSAADDSNVFKIPAAVKINKAPLKENNKVETATSPIIFDKMNDKCLNNSIMHLSNEQNVYSESNIEENIKNLSLFEKAGGKNLHSEVQNSKNSKRSGLKFRRVSVNPNCTVQNESKDTLSQNSNMEPTKRVFRKIVLNRNNHLKRNTTENFTKQSISYDKPQITETFFENALKPDGMQRFVVKDNVIKLRIESRFEEWMCCFSQIMEDCLTVILMDNLPDKTTKLAAPWTLQEAVVTIKELYLNKADVKSIADEMYNVISNANDNKGKLPKTMNAPDFMKLFGLGVRLLESLQIVLPLSVELQKSIEMLSNLLDYIQDPSRDMELPTNHSPIWRDGIDDTDYLNRVVPFKKQSDTIEYLMKHYPSGKDYEKEWPKVEQTNIQMQEELQTRETTVIKTFGSNLRNIRINKAKKITFENVLEESQLKENTKINKEKDPKVTDSESKENRKTLSNNPTNLNNGTEKPIKIVRKTNLFEDFETRIRNKSNVKEHFDLDALDFESGFPFTNQLYTHQSNNFLNNGRIYENNGNFASDESLENLENAIIFADNPASRINDFSISLSDKHTRTNDKKDNDDTNECSFESEGLHAYSFIRTFLTELSGSFKIIYDFIDNSIQEFRCHQFSEDAKKQLYDRANEIHLHVADIIGKLKTIIEREAAEKTKLKSLIVNAGSEAVADKRITRYRQVVSKCLEQAQLLESALKTILALANQHSDISRLDVDQINNNINYFNIYE